MCPSVLVGRLRLSGSASSILWQKGFNGVRDGLSGLGGLWILLSAENLRKWKRSLPPAPDKPATKETTVPETEAENETKEEEPAIEEPADDEKLSWL